MDFYVYLCFQIVNNRFECINSQTIAVKVTKIIKIAYPSICSINIHILLLLNLTFDEQYLSWYPPSRL